MSEKQNSDNQEDIEIFNDDDDNDNDQEINQENQNNDLQVDENNIDQEIDNLIGDDQLIKESEENQEKKKLKKPRTSNEQKKQQNLEKAKKEEEQKEKLKQEAKKIQSFMQKCHLKDTQDFQKNKPALRKIQSVDELIMKLSRQHIQQQFLDQKGLDNIADWIDKLPNGPEPPISLRKKLLQFIQSLPVQKSHLNGIKLGKIIYKISTRSEVKELKDIATQIVKKWSQILNKKENNQNN